jgi:hypothetical protein
VITILKKKQLLMALVVGLFAISSYGVPAASAHTLTPTPTKSDTRPGWGFGDKNHHHIGPPGHSVRPGDGDQENNDQGENGNDQGKHISNAQLNQFFAELHQLFLKYFG